MKTVTIADLKNNLSRYLREVRRGESLTVLNRDLPVARVVPLDGTSRLLEARRPAPDAARLQDVPLPPPLAVDLDIVRLLLEERGER